MIGLYKSSGAEMPVLLSAMLSPKEKDHVCRLLRTFQPVTQFTADPDADVVLRVATTNEIILSAVAPTTAFSITPFCLSQMLEASLNPFSYRPNSSQSLVNIFLIGKVFALVSLSPDDTKRLTSMILQMCGRVAAIGADVTYVVSPRPIDCSATVVYPCWIDSLFASRTFIEPIEVPRQKVWPKEQPSTALSRRPPPRPCAKPTRRGPGGRPLVPDRYQTSLAFPSRSDSQPSSASQPSQLRRSVSVRHREAVPGVLSLDAVFSPPSSQAQSQTVVERVDIGSQITIQEIEMELSQAGLRDGTPAKKSAPRTEFESLCHGLFRAESRIPVELEPGTGDTRSAINELELFSRSNEERKPRRK
jgi:hypothetical protein